jgi:hypothetical protein
MNSKHLNLFNYESTLVLLIYNIKSDMGEEIGTQIEEKKEMQNSAVDASRELKVSKGHVALKPIIKQNCPNKQQQLDQSNTLKQLSREKSPISIGENTEAQSVVLKHLHIQKTYIRSDFQRMMG